MRHGYLDKYRVNYCPSLLNHRNGGCCVLREMNWGAMRAEDLDWGGNRA